MPSNLTADEAFEIDPMVPVWYTGLLSVDFLWAPKTLQETISTGDRSDWVVDQHNAQTVRVGTKFICSEIPLNFHLQR